MRTHVLAALCCSSLAVAACAQFEQKATSKQPPPSMRCDNAVALGVGPGQGSARAIAERSMRVQYADARGYLLGQGFRRIRPITKFTECRKHALIASWYECTAVTRFCGR